MAMPIYSSIFGQMGMGINGLPLKNSKKLSHDENKLHHRVQRPLINKYSSVDLNRAWYQEYRFSILTEIVFNFDWKIMEMMPIFSIYSSTFGQIGMGNDEVPPPKISLLIIE